MKNFEYFNRLVHNVPMKLKSSPVDDYINGLNLTHDELKTRYNLVHVTKLKGYMHFIEWYILEDNQVRIPELEHFKELKIK